MNRIIKFLCLSTLITASASLAMDIDADRQAQLNKELLEAFALETTAKMQSLLAQGADVNAVGKYGSKLHETAKINYSMPYKVYNACKFLLENNANVNLEDPTFGETPLLIQHGAEVNKKSKDGVTAFQRAAYMNHPEICQLLVEHGANINTQDKWGWNGLMYAARDNHENICEFITQHNAQLNLKNEDGDTALMLAIKKCAATKNILAREACKKINSNRSLIALLGSKRKRQTSALREVPYDVVKLIAKELLKLEKQELLSQIPANNKALRLYVQNQLKKSKPNNGESHE
jgi:ankyrin repeat protein